MGCSPWGRKAGHNQATKHIHMYTYILIMVAQMVKNACSVGDPGSTPWSGRFFREGNGNHSSILLWRIPWTEEPGGYSPWGCNPPDTTE